MSNPDFIVKVCSYAAGRFRIAINGKKYEYEVSPYMADKFKRALKYNRGRAVALIRGHEVPELVTA